jgi:hypothetical protein
MPKSEYELMSTYLSILQANIARMANNCVGCKTACIAIITILCSISGLTGCRLFISCIFPILLFCYLDTVYLSLERGYRKKFDAVVKSFKENSVSNDDLFDMHVENYHGVENITTAFLSWSIWPIYLILFILCFLLFLFL